MQNKVAKYCHFIFFIFCAKLELVTLQLRKGYMNEVIIYRRCGRFARTKNGRTIFAKTKGEA
jgi:hypothetical protein